MKLIIKLEESEDFLSAATEVWCVDDCEVKNKFEEVVKQIKQTYNLYETYEEYKEIMAKYYSLEATEEEYFDEINRLGVPVRRLTSTEVFFEIDGLNIRVKIIDCSNSEHHRIEIA